MKSESENSKYKGHIRLQCGMAILVSMSSLTYGLQCGWVSPMAKILQSAESPVGRPLTDAEISLVAGLPSISAMIGIFILMFFVDIYGRRKSIILMVALQLMCWVIKLCPINPTSLFIARLFCGLGAGGCFNVIPMYIKEISQDNIRGTLGATSILGQNMGILIMYCMGGYLDYYTVLYIVVGLPVVTILLLLKAPESPTFLVKIGKLEDAAATVGFLRGLDAYDKQVLTEIDLIKREDDYFKSIPNISFFSIFKDKAWRRGFIIMLMIISIHALNGAFSIVNYAAILLANSESIINPELQSLGIPVFMTIGTLITMSSIDRLGRKFILGIALGISALTFFGLATSMLMRDHGWATPGWLPLVAILIAVCCYGGGVSPVPFIIMSELFNFQIRAKLMACLCISAWGLTFIQLVSFTAITNSFGAYVAFYIFGIMNLTGGIIVAVLLPETAKKSVDQIEKELRKEKNVTEKIFDT